MNTQQMIKMFMEITQLRILIASRVTATWQRTYKTGKKQSDTFMAFFSADIQKKVLNKVRPLILDIYALFNWATTGNVIVKQQCLRLRVSDFCYGILPSRSPI